MRRTVENLKSFLLIVLGVSMLMLWTGYIYIQFDPAEAKASRLDGSFWIFTDDSQHYETVTDEKYFRPISVSLVLSGKGYTSSFAPELTNILYNDCIPLITEVLSSEYVCEGSTREQWDKALSGSDFILVEYASQLAYSYVAEFLHVEGELCSGEQCYTEKLLLYNDSRNTLTALSVDSSGNVFSFTRNSSDAPSIIYDFNSNNLAAYTVNKGFIPFSFNKSASGVKAVEELPSEYKLLHTAPSLPSVSVSTPLQIVIDGLFESESTTYFDLIGDDALSKILRAFEINPNIVGYYSDKNSGLYFVGEEMHLVVSPDGRVIYSVTDKSRPVLTVPSLLDTTRADFTSDEILTAATVFMSRLPSEVLGGDSVPMLKNVSYSSVEREITFTFSYYYMLTELTQGNGSSAINLTFNENGLLKADFVPVSVTAAEGDTSVEKGLLTTDIVPFYATKLAPSGFTSLRPIYTFNEFGETVTPYWAVGGYKK